MEEQKGTLVSTNIANMVESTKQSTKFLSGELLVQAKTACLDAKDVLPPTYSNSISSSVQTDTLPVMNQQNQAM